jgi:hypothetical protein
MMHLRGFGRAVNENALFKEKNFEEGIDSFEMPSPGEIKRIDRMCAAAGLGRNAQRRTYNGHRWNCPICRDIQESALDGWWERAGVPASEWPRDMCPTSVVVKTKRFYNIPVFLRISKVVDDYWIVGLSTWRSQRSFVCDGLRGLESMITATVAPLVRELVEYEGHRKTLAASMKEIKKTEWRLQMLGRVNFP